MRQGLAQMLAGVVTRDVSPPLYFVLAHAWIRAFGSDEVGVRSLSVLLGCASIPLAYACARRLFDRPTAVAVAALLAVSAPHVRHSQSARMYALFVFLALASFTLFAPLPSDRREGPRRPAAWALAAVNLALAYTHTYGLFVPVLQVLTLVWVGARAAARVFAVTHTGAAALFFPWLLVAATQAWDRREGFWIGRPDVWSLYHVLYEFVESPGLAKLMILLAAAACLAAWWPARGDRSGRSWPWEIVIGAWLASALAVAFVASHLLTPVFVARYFLFLLPLYLMLVVRGLFLVRGRWARAGLLAALLTAMVQGPLAAYFAHPQAEQWREAVSIIRGSGRPWDHVMITGGEVSFRNYFGLDPRVLNTVTHGIRGAHLPAGEVLRRLEGHRHLWAIYSPYAPPQVEEGCQRALEQRFEPTARVALHRLRMVHYRRRDGGLQGTGREPGP